MKITILGKNKLIKKEINNIINDLKLTDVEVINNENNKYNIK